MLIMLFAFMHSSFADDSEAIKRSRYSRYSFCMDRALGAMWWEKYEVRLQLNAYGSSHPTAEAMTNAPANVQAVDARCRRENKITSPRDKQYFR